VTIPSVTPDAKETFSKLLLRWWRQSGRDFRWRQTRDDYELLVAELLLRRTNAHAVEPVYDLFLGKYPKLPAFVRAKPADIRRIINPLGLAWRAENIVILAKHLKQHNLQIPTTIHQLQGLPGIGPYVARAVLINADGLRVIAIDTNVVRVVCRYFGLPEADSLRRHKGFQAFADSLVRHSLPRQLNYALLDLASLICRPKRPHCHICPLSANCCWSKANESAAEELP